MISILVPVYNTDVRRLVGALVHQINQDTLTAEIIVLDDGSDNVFNTLNDEIKSYPVVTIHRHPTNLGRIAARRKLATLARYRWLLFIDADSLILNDDFLNKYFDAANAGDKVVAGGRIYARQPPADCSLHLHWRYGWLRERRWSLSHGRHGGFQSNNFLIERDSFLQLSFPEAIGGYGHEDTWIGIQLANAGIQVKHINNPVLHAGLEPCEHFLQKSEEAVRSLWSLAAVISPEILSKHVSLFRVYRRLRKARLLHAVSLFYILNATSIRRNLRSCRPKLFWFDLYRLHYLSKIAS